MGLIEGAVRECRHEFLLVAQGWIETKPQPFLIAMEAWAWRERERAFDERRLREAGDYGILARACKEAAARRCLLVA